MSRNIPDFDPYIVLGVNKNASNSEIKTAYRRLALKCHPDKVLDELLRPKATDEFQKIQESYAILSDEGHRQKYDQEIRLAELRKEVRAQKAAAESYSYSSRGTSSREYRDGRFYEERAPADAGFFTDSDEMRYTDEPASFSHKYDESPKRPYTKVTEEKRKAKTTPVATATPKATRQNDREYARAGHYDRAKVRTKERRRDVSDKYERTSAAYVVSDAEGHSDSEIETSRYKTKVESEARYMRRESAPRYSKADSVPAYASRKTRHRSASDSESSASDDDYEPEYASKLDSQQSFLKEYISRKKDPVIEVDRRPRASRHAGYEERDHRHAERESPRFSSRSYSKTENVHVTEVPSSRTTRRSHERLDSPVRGYERERERTVPSMSTASSQKVSSSRAPPPVTRSATAPYPTRSRREGSSRSESKVLPSLVNMVAGLSGETMLPSRSSRPRATERNDSGYSSGPPTPEMPQGVSSTTAKINRYKVVETPDRELETVIVEPKDSRYRSSSPPPSRSERPSTSSRATKPTRTYTYEPEILTRRPVPVSSKSTSAARPLYGEIKQSPEIVLDGRRYQRRQPAY